MYAAINHSLVEIHFGSQENVFPLIDMDDHSGTTHIVLSRSSVLIESPDFLSIRDQFHAVVTIVKFSNGPSENVKSRAGRHEDSWGRV